MMKKALWMMGLWMMVGLLALPMKAQQLKFGED